MPLSRFQAFDTYLRSNGIPIDGLSGDTPYGPTTVTIQYQASATQQQIDWAEQAKQTFDWRPRRFLSDAVIASAYAGLTTQQQNALLRRLVALLIRQNESAVLQIFSDLGQSLPYDEVAP
jgi:hypothetical protein